MTYTKISFDDGGYMRISSALCVCSNCRNCRDCSQCGQCTAAGDVQVGDVLKVEGALRTVSAVEPNHTANPPQA